MGKKRRNGFSQGWTQGWPSRGKKKTIVENPDANKLCVDCNSTRISIYSERKDGRCRICGQKYDNLLAKEALRLEGAVP